MHDLPSTMKCGFCDGEAKLVDRRKNGLKMIFASFIAGGLTGWYFGGAVGVMDGLILFALGLYWALRSERYVYACGECTNVMVPK